MVRAAWLQAASTVARAPGRMRTATVAAISCSGTAASSNAVSSDTCPCAAPLAFLAPLILPS
jgi:hypothetical protein